MVHAEKESEPQSHSKFVEIKTHTSLTSPWSIFLLFLLYLSPRSAVRTVITPNWITHSNLEILLMLTYHLQKNCNFVDTKSYLVPFHHVWNPFRHLIYSISLNNMLNVHICFLKYVRKRDVFTIVSSWIPARSFKIFYLENGNMFFIIETCFAKFLSPPLCVCSVECRPHKSVYKVFFEDAGPLYCSRLSLSSKL